MKVLFLSISAGQGHHQTALALMDEMKARGHDCKFIDTFEYINRVLGGTVEKTYLVSTASMPKVWGMFYSMAETNGSGQFSGMVPTLLKRKIKKLIDDYSPDAIVCTHVFAAQFVDLLKSRGELKSLSVTILTDFTVHPFWEELKNIDVIVTANELLDFRIHQKGLDTKKILPVGIPVKTKFASKMEKSEARRLLGIDEEKFTLLIMSGSMGHGNMAASIEELDALSYDFQMLIVCGNNEKMKEEIEAVRTRKKLHCYGFVDNVDVMMDASDCIVTKPGGLTTSEALAKNLPMIVLNPIPGQEERNLEFLLNYGLVMRASPTFPIAEALYAMLKSPETAERLKSNMKLFARPNAARDLSDYIEKRVQEE